jgi:glucose-6-phosphate isomerase, archaeal
LETQIEFNWMRGFTVDFNPETGMSKTAISTKRYLSDMEGMFADEKALKRAIENKNDLVYEFYNIGAPEKPCDLSFGTSVTYPGKVANEFFMTKGHFHTVLETAEVYYCLRGDGYILLENPEGDWSAQELAPSVSAYIPPRYAHRSINTGKVPLITFYAFRGDAGHDYSSIEKKGFQKLMVEKDGKAEIVDNPKWK